MSSRADYFLSKTLGEDFLESLAKTELWKPATRTVSDLEDINLGLKLVPRVLMSLLIRELTSMKVGDHKDINLPLPEKTLVRVDKFGPDVYSGDIESDGKLVVDFKYRSIPGVGLVIMSAFELYDVEKLSEDDATEHEPKDTEIRRLVDERMALHHLVENVVDKKIREKEAVEKLILIKLTNAVSQDKAKLDLPKKDIEVPSKLIMNKLDKKEESEDKGSEKLKKFIEKKKSKHKSKEFSINILKGESVSCPDCGKKIFDGSLFSGCICYGSDMEKKLFVKNTSDGVKIKFSRSWDPENISMLLDVIRRKNG